MNHSTLRDQSNAALRMVDLFSGGGGLSWGVRGAAHENRRTLEIPLAVDSEPTATAVYRDNFTAAEHVGTGPVETFFDGPVGSRATIAERRTRSIAQDVDLLVGGPPCQGHSNLNNRTRRVDGKNALYLRMVRAAEILHPRMVLIENVPSVVSDRHDGEGVVIRAERHLASLGYRISSRVIPLVRLGVPQSRRRHVLLAVEGRALDPGAILEGAMADRTERDLGWAIEDLVDAPEHSLFDRRPRPTPDNLERMQYLLDNDLYDLPNEFRPACHQGDHTYVSMYGRLRWDRPAQTITSGYGSPGQGRYMHPDQPRALTAHEAARIQGFPDEFDFSACTTRSALATMIGNAVPPRLAEVIVDSYLRLDAARDEPATRSA